MNACSNRNKKKSRDEMNIKYIEREEKNRYSLAMCRRRPLEFHQMIEFL